MRLSLCEQLYRQVLYTLYTSNDCMKTKMCVSWCFNDKLSLALQ